MYICTSISVKSLKQTWIKINLCNKTSIWANDNHHHLHQEPELMETRYIGTNPAQDISTNLLMKNVDRGPYWVHICESGLSTIVKAASDCRLFVRLKELIVADFLLRVVIICIIHFFGWLNKFRFKLPVKNMRKNKTCRDVAYKSMALVHEWNKWYSSHHKLLAALLQWNSAACSSCL